MSRTGSRARSGAKGLEPGELRRRLDPSTLQLATTEVRTPNVARELAFTANQRERACPSRSLPSRGRGAEDRSPTGPRRFERDHRGRGPPGDDGRLWQALACGFAGIRPRGNALIVDPRLPKEWNALEFGLRFRERPLRLRIDRSGVTATPADWQVEQINEEWEVTAR